MLNNQQVKDNVTPGPFVKLRKCLDNARTENLQ